MFFFGEFVLTSGALLRVQLEERVRPGEGRDCDGLCMIVPSTLKPLCYIPVACMIVGAPDWSVDSVPILRHLILW